MDAATTRRLVDGAAALDVALSPTQVDQLAHYLALLQRWNRKINLTAITDPEAIVELHFLDSLAATALVRDCATLVDVGSGAGFPGAVLAIALPALRVTCVDTVGKKVAFLQVLRRTVASNLEPLQADGERLGRTFDAAISRATWEPAEWVQRGVPLVAPGGLLIAMQTAEAAPIDPPAGFARLAPRQYRVGGADRKLQPFRRT